MAYNPGIQDRSGELLGAGIAAGGANIAGALQSVADKRDQGQAADATMAMLMQIAPDAFPKGEGGQVDAAFLERFYGAPLKAKQETLGMLASKVLTPTEKARVGLMEAQTGQIQQETRATAGAVGAAANYGANLKKWSQLRGGKAAGGSAAGPAPISEPALPMQGDAATRLTPLGLSPLQ